MTTEEIQGIESKITGLTDKQAAILVKMLDLPDRSLTFSNQDEGGVVGSLSKLGLVENWGRIGTATRRRIKPEVAQVKSNRVLIRELSRSLNILTNSFGGETVNG
jgi:hypothetical protein